MNRALALTVLLALALAPAVQAQEEFDFQQSYYVRVSVGDIPTTNATEAEGMLNVVEYLRLDHDGNQTQVTFDADAAGDDVSVGCDCGSASRTGNTITVGSDVEAGEVVVSVTHAHAFRDAATVPLALEPSGDAAVTFLLGDEYGVSSDAEPETTLEGADFDGTITQYDEVAAWFVVRPAGDPAFAETETVEVVRPDGGIEPLSIIIGLVLGAIVWFFLVQQGVVQKRRRQEVAVAAHREAATREPKPVLEGRKRLLMAALKDLEMARMNKEISDDAYDKLKADFKKQAVTTMRALEEAS